MDIERISGLKADIVPHRQWPVSKWFYANELWYYHRLGTDEEILTGRKFYQLVDDDLRELCYVLIEAGLHTTPSCQGHFYNRQRFEKIWEELLREGQAIRGAGLKMTDSETQKEYLFAEADYRLPWERFEQFYDQAGAQQGIGYIGVIVPADREDLRERIEGVSYCDAKSEITYDRILSRILRGHVFNIFVRSSGPEERGRIWKYITDWMRLALIPAKVANGVESAGSFWNIERG
jgi:hypothetical protein